MGRDVSQVWRQPAISETPTGRPDVDNYAKAVMDALNGIAYNDDSQVACLTSRKQYAAAHGVLIQITPWVPG